MTADPKGIEPREVGIIGLGRMGLPIACNLIAAGFTVLGYRRGDMAAFTASGGVAASSPRAVAERCGVIITSLPGDEALAEVVSGPAGIVRSGRENLLVIELSTLSLAVKEAQRRALAAAGGRMLDCPISGVPAMAAARKAILFASGDRQDYDEAREVLDGFTDEHHYIGPFGQGLKLKFIANMLVGIHTLAAAEAMVLGVKAGLAPEAVIRIIGPSVAGSRTFEIRAPMMAKRAYEPAPGPIRSLHRQLVLIRAFARDAGVPAPLLDVTLEYFEKAMREGRGDQDQAALFSVLEAEAPGSAGDPRR